jgi:hypothetical protein
MQHDRKVIPLIARAAVLGLALLTGACTGIGGPSPAAPTGAAIGSATAASPTESPLATTTETPPTPSGESPNSSATPLTPAITEEQAIAAVQAFAPNASGLRVTESDTVSSGRSYRVQSTDIIAEVDQATGQVRTFLDNAEMPTSTTVKLTKDEALAAASAWLAARAVSTGGLSPAVTLMDHGSTQEYAVSYQGRVNGARVPHSVNVSIDPATGAIYAFVLFTRPFVTPPAPRLTSGEAAIAAREEERDPGAKVTSTDLAIDFDAAGNQVLVYELDLTRTDGFYAKVQVNALTGTVVVMGRG